MGGKRVNGVDIAILVMIGISVIFGVYRGFLQTVLSVAAVIVSLFVAMSFGPRLSAVIQGQTTFAEALANYTDAVSRVGDVDLAKTEVDGASPSLIERVINAAGLPPEIASYLRSNLQTLAYRNQGKTTVNDYVRTTLVSAAVDVISYVLCFFASSLIFSLLISLLKHVCKFPPLRTMDGLAGGLFGLVRGVLIVYVLFLLLPVAETIVPDQGVQKLLADSRLAGMFQSGGFFSRVLAGRF